MPAAEVDPPSGGPRPHLPRCRLPWGAGRLEIYSRMMILLLFTLTIAMITIVIIIVVIVFSILVILVIIVVILAVIQKNKN